jgi:hypothetical protein
VDYRALFERDYLAAWELKGKDVTVTIDKVEPREMRVEGGAKMWKPVVFFVGKRKGLVLNITNAATIAALHGDDTDGWIGRPITLFAEKTTLKNKQVEGIRVRGAGQQLAPAPAPGNAQQSSPLSESLGKQIRNALDRLQVGKEEERVLRNTIKNPAELHAELTKRLEQLGEQKSA